MPDTSNDIQPSEALAAAIADVISRFDAVSTARDSAVTDGRQVVRLAANAVRALHRGDDASGLLGDARALLDSIREKTLPVNSGSDLVATAATCGSSLNGTSVSPPKSTQITCTAEGE